MDELGHRGHFFPTMHWNRWGSNSICDEYGVTLVLMCEKVDRSILHKLKSIKPTLSVNAWTMLFSKMQPSQKVMHIFKNKYEIQLRVCPKIKKVRHLFMFNLSRKLLFFKNRAFLLHLKLFFKSLLTFIFNYQTGEVSFC